MQKFLLSHYVRVEAGYRNMEVRIITKDETLLRVVNSYLEKRLEAMKDLGQVKSYKNLIDVFIVWPMRGVTVQELVVDFNKLALT